MARDPGTWSEVAMLPPSFLICGYRDWGSHILICPQLKYGGHGHPKSPQPADIGPRRLFTGNTEVRPFRRAGWGVLLQSSVKQGDWAEKAQGGRGGPQTSEGGPGSGCQQEACSCPSSVAPLPPASSSSGPVCLPDGNALCVRR